MDILSDIHAEQRRVIKLRKDAVLLDAEADNFFRYGLTDQGKDKREEADKLRASANRIEEVKLKKLKNAYAEFQTELLPGMGDDKGVVLKPL